MTPPEVQQLGPAVVLSGIALRDVRDCIIRSARALRSDGIAWPPRLTHLVGAIDAAIADGMSRNGHDDVAPADPLADLPLERHQIGTTQTATILGLSPRQVQRIAHSLDGHRAPGRAWVFDKDTVRTYQQERTRENR